MKRPHADLAIKYFLDDTVEIQFKAEEKAIWEDCAVSCRLGFAL